MASHPRPIEKQSQHDVAMELIAKTEYDLTKYAVTINPNKKKRKLVKRRKRGGRWDLRWPDIVVEDKNLGKVTIIGEVETEDSIRLTDARRQWKPYANLKKTFYLYVPKGCCELAKEKCDRLGIKLAGIRHYQLKIKVKGC